MPLIKELPGPSAAGARRLERWLSTLPGAVALRAEHAAPGLSLSASQPDLTARACTPIETRVTLAGGAHGDATATIPKAISEVVEHDVAVALRQLGATLGVRRIARARASRVARDEAARRDRLASRASALCLLAVRPPRRASPRARPPPN